MTTDKEAFKTSLEAFLKQVLFHEVPNEVEKVLDINVDGQNGLHLKAKNIDYVKLDEFEAIYMQSQDHIFIENLGISMEEYLDTII